MVRTAMERCAYCGRDVPVTWIQIRSGKNRTSLSGKVAVCEDCRTVA